MAGFSHRSRFEAAQNRLTRRLAELREQGCALLDLSESNPTRTSLALSADELLGRLHDPRVAHYAPEPFGLASARQAVAEELATRGYAIPSSDILLTASTSEAYGYLLKLLCDPGDSVLVPAPSYPLFDVLGQLEGVRLVPYRLAYDGEWHLDLASLRAARASERVRALITVHPNNPTGSYLKRSELGALAALGLPIVSDEVFADYALEADAERVTSLLELARETLVFRLGGLSKAALLPQLKLAWTAIAGPKPLLDEARARLEHLADAYLSPGAQVQGALPRLLEAGATHRPGLISRLRGNGALLRSALAESAASVLSSEGGWYAIVRLPALLDDEEWALTLLDQDRVLVQPGYYYDLIAGTYVVLSLMPEPDLFAEGVARLAQRVRVVSR